MPEIVKYERIQTAETDLHAARHDDEDIAFPSPTAGGGVPIRRQSTNGIESQLEMPATRFRYNVAQTTAATVALILFYFCLSIGLTFFQRFLLKVSKKKRPVWGPFFVVITMSDIAERCALFYQ